MAKKMIMACVCDLCGKSMSEDEARYTITMGIGNWKNDSVRTTFEKDLCKECYKTLIELIDKDEVEVEEKPKVEEEPKAEPVYGDKTYESEMWGKSKYDLDKAFEMYCNGFRNCDIKRKIGCNDGYIGFFVRKLERLGYERGCNKVVKIEEKPKVQLRTVVDGNGLVTMVE